VPLASRRLARAFAPHHVTGLFSPSLEARDPRARGSVGAGLVLDRGVTAIAEWEPGRRRRIDLESSPGARLEISGEVTRRLLAERTGRLRVRLEHALPIGQGFGASAAGALATGLAVASVLGVPERRAVEVAHLAELFGRGGLGGVAAILGGGLELRLRPGVPPFGQVRHRRVRADLIVGVVGPPIPSAGLLGGRRAAERFRKGTELLEELARAPDLNRFWEASSAFTEAVGLASPRLRSVLGGLRLRGAHAVQTMFGESFLASRPPGASSARIVRWLTEQGVRFWEVGTGARGARTLSVIR
jgi:pantoate kinase